MTGFCPPFTTTWRLYKRVPAPKFTTGLPSARLPSVFNSCIHHLCLLTFNPMLKLADSQLYIPPTLSHTLSYFHVFLHQIMPVYSGIFQSLVDLDLELIGSGLIESFEFFIIYLRQITS
ncbi:hypothetical protein KSS87_022136 [Heliosperma pusillum]|nr:hypothetical protein KSS87_022136 [Heliosperma pusillum]